MWTNVIESGVLMVKGLMAMAGCEEKMGSRDNGVNLQRAGDSGVRLQEYSSALVLPPSFSSSFSFSLAVDLQDILCWLAKDTLRVFLRLYVLR